ncbi:MAG: hypothetical protein WCC17_12650, partial [Candidatus Nitrosopolaris sp.]
HLLNEEIRRRVSAILASKVVTRTHYLGPVGLSSVTALVFGIGLLLLRYTHGGFYACCVFCHGFDISRHFG